MGSVRMSSEMVGTRTLLDRLLHSRDCYDAVPELEALCKTQPQEMKPILWEYLQRSNPRLSDMGIDALIVWLFLETSGEQGGEQLMREWPHLSADQRQVICRGAFIADGLSESLILRLFHHPASDVAERHLLTAGLASSVEERDCEPLLLSLVERIGEYGEDLAHRQESLDQFRKDVRRSFPSSIPVHQEYV